MSSHIEQTIKKAIEGNWYEDEIKRFGEFKFLRIWQPYRDGYRYEVIREDGMHDYLSLPSIEIMVLDWKFWQALGKVLGWDERTFSERLSDYSKENWKVEKIISDCGGYKEIPQHLKDLIIKEIGEKDMGWLYQATKYFRDYAMEGKSAESYFEKL